MTNRLRIGVTGASGLLGAHVITRLCRDHDVVGADRHQWWGDQPIDVRLGDLLDSAYRADFWRAARPDVLVHCAALIDVDGCERDPERAYAANDRLTAALVAERPAGCFIVYVSTDAVFSGEKPYAAESDLPCPATVYGRSKLHGEWNVQLGGPDHAVVRTNFYGWSSGRKKTSAEWLVGALERREPIRLFNDFYFTPIYVGDLADRIAFLIERRITGLFHIAGRDRLSKLDFGRLVAEAGGLSLDAVTPGSIRDAAFAARRPGDLSLSAARFLGLTGQAAPGAPEGVSRFLADRHLPLSARGVSVTA